jgi:cytochrome c-type biogenesis protein CcmH
MTLWIILTSLTCMAAVLLTITLVRRVQPPISGRERATALWRAQIAEIDHEVEQGSLSPDEAGSARAEVERRIVAAAKEQGPETEISPEKFRLVAVAAVVGWLVAGSTLLYAFVGRPDLPAAPFRGPSVASVPTDTVTADVITSSDPALDAGNVGDMITGLADRLATNPDDADGWQMLGWSYFNTQRYREASEAYAKAVAITGDDSELLSLYGETLVRAADGMVTDQALEVFDKAVALNSADARARFFQGMAIEQQGDPAAAVEAWIVLLNSAPPGADWAASVEQRIRELAAASDISLEGRMPEVSDTVASLTPSQPAPAQPAPGPTADDVSAAMEMTPDDRQAMIRGMVDKLQARLDDNPDDADGWIRLMRSRLVLGEEDAARTAYRRASDVFADATGQLERINTAAGEMGLSLN